MKGLAARANSDRPMAGIVMMLVAYAFFSCIDASAKWLALAGFAALQLAFMRYFGHFVISLALIGRGGFGIGRFTTERPLLVIVRAALLMISTVANFFAVRYLPLTLTSTILFSAPIITCVLSWPLLGERVGVWRWCAIALGFCGILIAIRPFDESFHWAVCLSLTAATGFAFYSVLTRKLSGVVATDTMQFYSGLIGTAALLPFAIAEWRSPETAWGWALLVGMGVFGWLGHELLTRAHGFAPATVLMPFGYVFIIYLTVWSYFLFDRLPDRWTVVGAAIIVFAGMIIWERERRLRLQRRAIPTG